MAKAAFIAWDAVPAKALAERIRMRGLTLFPGAERT